jgi:hypothetical protein
MTGVCTFIARPKAGEPCNGTCLTSSGGKICIVEEMPAPPVGGPSPPPPPLNAGECYKNDGLYCASDWTCQPLSAPGGPCTDYNACQADAYCSTTSVCTPKKAEGQPCSNFDECVGSCDYATMRCTGNVAGALDVTAAICADQRRP